MPTSVQPHGAASTAVDSGQIQVTEVPFSGHVMPTERLHPQRKKVAVDHE